MGDTKASNAADGQGQFAGREFQALGPIPDPKAQSAAPRVDSGYERGLWSLFIGDQPEMYPRSTRWLGRLIIVVMIVISIIAGAVYLAG